MLNPVVSAIVYFCEMLIAYIFLSNLAERRYDTLKCLLIGVCLFTICAAFNLISLNSVVVNALAMPTIHFLFAFLCFRLRFYSAVFYSAILCTLCAALEFATIFAASAMFGGAIKDYNNDPMLLIMELSISKTIYFIISLFLSRIMKVPQYSGKLPLSIFLYPIITQICLVILFYLCVVASIAPVHRFLFSVVSVLMFVSTVLLGFTYQHQIEKDNEYMRVNHMLSQLQIEKNYYDILAQQNQQLMIYAHDAKNHLAAIRALNTDPLINGYISKLSDQLEHYSRNCHSGNKLLDVIINRYVVECDQEGITFDYDVKLYNLKDIEDVDLVSILGNLMNNAIEAAKQTKEKKIYFETTKRNRYHVLLIRNSSLPPKKENDRLITSKKDHTLHGFGLKSVANTLRRYNGDLQWDYDNTSNTFIMTVMIEIK